MPYTVRKVPRKPCYKVMNKKTKRVFAKCTTMEKAQKQMRLLRAIENSASFRAKIKRPIRGRKTIKIRPSKKINIRRTI